MSNGVFLGANVDLFREHNYGLIQWSQPNSDLASGAMCQVHMYLLLPPFVLIPFVVSSLQLCPNGENQI